MKFILTEEQHNKVIERTINNITDIIRTSSLSNDPLYSKVRTKYDGDRFIITMYVNTFDLTDELQDYLDDVYNLTSDYTNKSIYVMWQPVT
jgi:hypothetical protein